MKADDRHDDGLPATIAAAAGAARGWRGGTDPVRLRVHAPGWLRPGYSAKADAVSDLGVGEGAWLQTANFLLFGLLLLAFAAGFRRAMSSLIGPREATVAASLIAATGLGVAASGVFPAAPPTEGLHLLLGFLLAFASAIGVVFYVGRRLRGVVGWEGPRRYSTWTGVGALLLIAFSFVALNPASPLEEMGIGGLIERLLAVEVFAWHAVMGWRLLHDGGGRRLTAASARGTRRLPPARSSSRPLHSDTSS